MIREGESALKESIGVKAENCRFEGRYPLWCCSRVEVSGSEFTSASRAPIWYSSDLRFSACVFDSPKSFRELDRVELVSCRFPSSVETLWNCRNVTLRDCRFDGADYFFARSSSLKADGLRLQGKYSFQYCRDIEIRNSHLDTKDAFWESENVTVYDSEVKGEYLGWYSKGLTLVRCHISGTQPLCYAKGLRLVDCTFAPDADLAFEYSEVEAVINGPVTSVKNPLTGRIEAESFGEIIIDANLKAPGDCVISVPDRGPSRGL